MTTLSCKMHSLKPVIHFFLRKECNLSHYANVAIKTWEWSCRAMVQQELSIENSLEEKLDYLSDNIIIKIAKYSYKD
jgi:hypothetical protein